MEVLQATDRLSQLPNVWSGHVTSQDPREGHTYQLGFVGTSMFLQVLGDVPIREPRSYDAKADSSPKRDIRNFKDGN